MGGKQSTTTAGTTSSSSSPINTFPTSLTHSAGVVNAAAGRHNRLNAPSTTAQYHRSSLNPHQLVGVDSRQRARSLSHVPILASASSSSSAGAGSSAAGGAANVIGIGIPTAALVHAAAASGNGGIFGLTGSPADSDGSSTTPDDSAGNSLENALFGGRVYAAHSLPTQLSSAFNGIKCPVCSKFVIPDDLEYHLVMCLTKPRISYNEDVLSEDKGECVICLDDLQQGDTIARLPCLCIYHKCCIDSWFEVNRSCPEHPSD